jgi:hypothetical protein
MRDEEWDAGLNSETENGVRREEGGGMRLPHYGCHPSSLLTPFSVSLCNPVSTPSALVQFKYRYSP